MVKKFFYMYSILGFAITIFVALVSIFNTKVPTGWYVLLFLWGIIDIINIGIGIYIKCYRKKIKTL